MCVFGHLVMSVWNGILSPGVNQCEPLHVGNLKERYIKSQDVMCVMTLVRDEMFLVGFHFGNIQLKMNVS